MMYSKRSVKWLIVGIACLLFVNASQAASFPENPFIAQGNWYRANLHGHTLASDGKLSLEERAKEYREAGYDVIATTDHRTTSEVKDVCRDDFLVISGMETHPRMENGELYHLVALDVPKGLHFDDSVPVLEQLSQLNAAGASCFIAHPYWSGFSLEDFRPIADKVIGVEVYNTGTESRGRAFSSVHWDSLLGAGYMMPAFAVDDVHGKGQFGGYIMIKAQSLNKDAIMDAIKKGRFYATMGAELKDVRLEKGKITVRCSPAKKVYFMSSARKGYVVSAKKGETLTKAQYIVEPGLPWVRVEIVDHEGRHAWANPIDTSSIVEK